MILWMTSPMWKLGSSGLKRTADTSARLGPGLLLLACRLGFGGLPPGSGRFLAPFLHNIVINIFLRIERGTTAQFEAPDLAIAGQGTNVAVINRLAAISREAVSGLGRVVPLCWIDELSHETSLPSVSALPALGIA